MKNFIILLKYIFFLPIAFLLAFVSSLIMHIFVKVLCYFPAHWGLDACNTERPFIVELILLFVFVQASVSIIPRFKKAVALIELIPLGLFYIFVPIISLIKHKPLDSSFDIFILGCFAILTAVLIIKNNKDFIIIKFNEENHFDFSNKNDGINKDKIEIKNNI